MMPKVVYAWEGNPYKDPKNARLFMGVPKFPAGQGFLKLLPGDDPLPCRYCGREITEYPHSHTKADWDKEHGRV